MRPCSLTLWSPVGATPTASGSSNTRRICLTWCRQTFSYTIKPKCGLEGWSLDQNDIKNAWEGVARSLIAVDLAATFRSWLERCKKCVRLTGEFVEKSQEINILLALIVVNLCIDLHLFVFTNLGMSM